MKKERSKAKKIYRRKGKAESEIDPKHQEELAALATQFREDQLKIVLRRCYKNVQKYGPEVILKAMEDATMSMAPLISGAVNEEAFVRMEEEVNSLHVEEALEVDSNRIGSVSHSHAETAKKNALFLIESSERLEDYDLGTLQEMKEAYERGNYDDVADIAYLHDRSKRAMTQPPESRINDETTLLRDKPESPWHRVSELLEEVAEEVENESPLGHCVEAVRHLSRDLTYENRTAAKESIRRAIKFLEE